jgi:hypothetical protein
MAKLRDYNLSATKFLLQKFIFFENKTTFQMVAKLDSETWWTGELWTSKTNLQKLQN